MLKLFSNGVFSILKPYKDIYKNLEHHNVTSWFIKF